MLVKIGCAGLHQRWVQIRTPAHNKDAYGNQVVDRQAGEDLIAMRRVRQFGPAAPR
jgi:hypothetical protein